MFVSAVVAAAGEGTRLKSKVPKPLVQIYSRPLLVYSLKTLSRHPAINEIIVVVNSKNSRKIIKEIRQYRISKIKGFVLGGRRRQDSVYNGLRETDSRADLVLIHDAARPFINKSILSAAIKQARESGVVIAGVPLKATVKMVKGKGPRWFVEKTIDRKNLWEIQTPQVFKRNLILEACRKLGNEDVTDDAMLLEGLGRRVGLVLGSYDNIKITTPEDLVIARAIAKKWNLK
jgi:2-C-methyl-D-erythritol 4-phosphate cytidylyltransferase